jgi:hypothetical protein
VQACWQASSPSDAFAVPRVNDGRPKELGRERERRYAEESNVGEGRTALLQDERDGRGEAHGDALHSVQQKQQRNVRVVLWSSGGEWGVMAWG